MNSKRFISLFHYGTGLMDALTGLCLIVLPSWTLGLMGVNPPGDLVFLSYIGVFVFAIGASHFLVGQFPSDIASRERWKTIWKVSALARLCVAVFVLVKITSGQLETAWISVTATDFIVAMILINFLKRRALNTP
ncbi:MAG: hypothetical protein ABF391_00345 [Akkermansiaceae bacterium]